MCHITTTQPAVPPGRNECGFFLGTALHADKDDWIKNAHETNNLKISCRHDADGKTEIHTLKPGQTLVCESPAELICLDQSEKA